MANVDDAIQFLRHAVDAESENRTEGLNCLEFSYGRQWPEYAINSRGQDRPRLTINETNTYIKKVTNAQRQQRPRGKASPVDNFADKKVAKVITGISRHIDVQSDADNAYDTAFEFAARIGWGYWRLRSDFPTETSFSQEIYVDLIDNPFSVYFDFNSIQPDGSDAEKALISTLMLKENFRKEYKGALDGSGFNDRGAGDNDPTWVTENDIRLAEYYYIERVRAKLVQLTDGTIIWADQLPPAEVLAAAGVAIKGDRDSYKRTVNWCKQTQFEILEEKTLPGRWIPIIPVYWTNTIIDGKRIKRGLVYDAIDPQRMINFWQTSITESIALAPKAKWLIAEGQDEGHENEFKNANLSSSPTLHYKATDVMGQPVPPPIRMQPEPPPAGAIEASFMATQNLSRVLGVFDPAVRGGAQHKSDKTLNAERSQSEMTTFDGYDNLVRSIKHSERIKLSWYPTIYDTQQALRIIGEDGREEIVTINERTQVQDDMGNAVEKVLNDVRVGEYDVVMETGPGYDTQRKEGTAHMMELLATPLGEMIAQSSGDLIIRGMDFPGADLIADRLAAANPMSQIDEKSDIPPRVQMMIKGLQQQLQQAGQQIQALETDKKYRLTAEQMKQEGSTKRTLIQSTADAHDTETWATEDRKESEDDNRTKILIEEMKSQTALLLKRIDERMDEKMAERKAAEPQKSLQ